MFVALGYVPCDTPDTEPGMEKVALFADEDGVPTHAARKLPGGRWTSKLGRLEDIEHALDGVAGEEYGVARRVMKRPIRPPTSGPPELSTQ